MTRTALYRFFDGAGVLLYVGISCAIDKRTAKHLSASDWTQVADRMDATFYPTREAALIAEWEAIRDENPVHNKRRAEPFRPKPEAKPRPQPKNTALAEHIKQAGMTQGAFAQLAGVSRSMLNELILGNRFPSLATALRIEAATGRNVPVSSWDNFAAVVAAAQGAR